jgi:hypothetical protein
MVPVVTEEGSMRLMLGSVVALVAFNAAAAPAKADITHVDEGGATRLHFAAPAGTTCKVDRGPNGGMTKEAAEFTFDAAPGKGYGFWCKLPDGTPWVSKVFAKGGKTTFVSLGGTSGRAAASAAPPPIAPATEAQAPARVAAASAPAAPAAPAAAPVDQGQLLRSLRARPFARERIELLDKAFATTRPTAASVAQLLRHFPYQHDKLALLAVLGDRLADPDQKAVILRQLPYPADRKRAERLLRKAPVAPAWY